MRKSMMNTGFWKPKVTLFGIVLLCSLGLCGANAAASGVFTSSQGIATQVILVTGAIELAGIVISAIGLFVSLAGLVVASLFGHTTSDDLHVTDRNNGGGRNL